uniref:Uncharacterized protein n=1 Tax=Aegilops tauschii subsp. strangulata TaxID=200361 RepID=A0A453HF74_AEGTS
SRLHSYRHIAIMFSSNVALAIKEKNCPSKIAMVGEWKPQNGQVRDEIDPSIPTDDKDFISSNTGMTDDDKDVATADEDTTGAGSASNMRKRGRHANHQIRELETYV